MTKVLKCNCEHEFQDSIYGNHMRLFNERIANGKNNGWRCTVCGKEAKV